MRVDVPLQTLSYENKNEFLDAIKDLKADGGTCLGTGLLQGLKVGISFRILHNR